MSLKPSIKKQISCSKEVDMMVLLPILCRRTGCDDLRVIGKPLKRRECEIYFIESAKLQQPRLVLKAYHASLANGNLAQIEHRKLRRLKQVETEACTVPESLLLLRKRNALVMEYIDTPTSAQFLVKGMLVPGRRLFVIRHAARWLQWFHSQSQVVDEPYQANHYLQKLADNLERIESFAPRSLAQDEFLNDCIEMVRVIVAEMNGKLMQHVSAHGDFTPFNLFVNEERAVGFDIGGRGRSPIASDISRFLIYLDVYQLFSSRRRDLRKFGCREKHILAFLNEYGLPAVEIEDTSHWLKFHFMEVVRRMVSLMMDQTRSSHRHALKPLEMKRLRRSAGEMMCSLIESRDSAVDQHKNLSTELPEE